MLTILLRATNKAPERPLIHTFLQLDISNFERAIRKCACFVQYNSVHLGKSCEPFTPFDYHSTGGTLTKGRRYGKWDGYSHVIRAGYQEDCHRHLNVMCY